MITRFRTMTIALSVCLMQPMSLLSQDASSTEPLQLLGYETRISADWQSTPPSSSMRLAQYRIGASPDSAAELVIYYFGAGQGGSVAANVARWSSQFLAADGSRVEPIVTQLPKTAFPTTIVSLEGTYARGAGVGMEANPSKTGQMLVAAIVESPKGSIFFQLHGPKAAVLEAVGAFQDLVTHLGPPPKPGAPSFELAPVR